MGFIWLFSLCEVYILCFSHASNSLRHSLLPLSFSAFLNTVTGLYYCLLHLMWLLYLTSLVAQMVKCLPTVRAYQSQPYEPFHLCHSLAMRTRAYTQHSMSLEALLPFFLHRPPLQHFCYHPATAQRNCMDLRKLEFKEIVIWKFYEAMKGKLC